MSGWGDPCGAIPTNTDGVSIIVSSSEPESPVLDTLWWDKNTKMWFQWDGVTWLPQNVVPEAPLSGGPFARENADWSPIFAGFFRIEAVSILPAVQVPGVVYLTLGE
jgi:hypothetical protein